jgi:hypothetical protein
MHIMRIKISFTYGSDFFVPLCWVDRINMLFMCVCPFLILLRVLQSEENGDQRTDGEGESLAMLQLSASLKLRDLVSRLDGLSERAFPYDC